MAYERNPSEDLVWDENQGEYVSANFVLTISPTPSDATVVLTATGYTQVGNTIAVPSGTTVTYTVSKTGYSTVTDTVTVTQDATVSVTLVSLFVVTVNPTPADAMVVLTATGYTQSGNTIAVPANTVVSYTVSKGGYNSVSSSVTVTQTTTISITLTSNVVQEVSIGGTVYDIYSKAVLNQNGGDSFVYNWIGTLAEYNNQNIATTHPDWVCLITDDNPTGEGTNVYTKAQIDSMLASYYTKTQIDSTIGQINGNITDINSDITDINTKASHYYYWTQTTLDISGTAYKEHSFTITPKLGRPIYLAFSSDENNNASTDTVAWAYYGLKKNGTTIIKNIDEVRHGGQNIPLAFSYLDTDVTAGTSITYTFFIQQMAGAATYGEAAEGYPREIAFEI